MTQRTLIINTNTDTCTPGNSQAHTTYCTKYMYIVYHGTA